MNRWEDVALPQQVVEIIRSVVGVYAPQDLGEITNSVEKVEISPADKPEQKLSIREISFHSILVVPSRITGTNEFTIPATILARLNAAMGF